MLDVQSLPDVKPPLALIAAAALAASVCAPPAAASRATRRTPVVIAVEKVGATVANISTEEVVLQRYYDPRWGSRDRFFGDMFEQFFGQYRKAKVATPLGSGVLIDRDGYIVTNEHVISRASNLKVQLQGEKIYEAELVSSDRDQDLAIIKIQSDRPFPSLPMGRSDDLMPGETVIAIGNPFGYENSVTTGVLSATRREVRVPTQKGELVYNDLIQTTALINPGNSGGPLINLDGELIGINTAIRADAQGIGFAIPVDRVKAVMATLFNFEKVKNLWFGADVAKRDGRLPGIVVKDVDARSPAQKAGLRQGDVILQVDSVAVRDLLDFEKYLFKRTVGSTVRLAVERSGRRRTVNVTLQAVPKPSGKALAQSKLGIEVETLTPALARRLRLRVGRGVLVIGVTSGGPGDAAQLAVGDVIVSMAQYVIRNVDELGVLLNVTEKGAAVRVGFVRRNAGWETRVKVR